MLYPGNFWRWYTCLGTQKWAQKFEQYSTQKSLFLKQIITSFLLCEIYWKLDILNTYLSVKYSMTEKKHGRFHKKTCNWYLKSDEHFFQTCDRWPFKTTKTLFMPSLKLDYNSK